MAVSTTIFNFFSLLSVSPPKPQQPLHFPLSPPSLSRFPSHRIHNLRNPLVATLDDSPPDLSTPVMLPSSFSSSGDLIPTTVFNVQVNAEDEPGDRVMSMFRREVMRSGIIPETKRRKFHENKQEKKKRKSREAAKRRSRARNYLRRGPRPGGKFPDWYNREDVPITVKEEDEDNWDLSEGEVLEF